MRGTVLKLKSHNFDCNTVEDDSEEESQNDESRYDRKNVSSKSTSVMDLESAPQDLNKNILMSSLELRRKPSVSMSNGFPAKKVTLPFHRPVFDWNHDSMWKAMVQHPLFPKYMELQSQLNSLFEEIRLDCKRAACEKAFSTLLKETAESPIETSTFDIHPVQPKPPAPVEPITKKRGRPLRKRPGRPRKYDSNTSSTGYSNGSAVAPLKHLRKCKEELFLSRKPSWICQSCAKPFSSAGWLDRHRSVCSFSKLASKSTVDQNQDASENDDTFPMSLNGLYTPKSVAGRTHSASRSSDTYNTSPSRSSETKIKLEMPHSPLLLSIQRVNPSVSPLQPKMENHHSADDDEELSKLVFDDEPQCSDAESNGRTSLNGSDRDIGDCSADSDASTKYCKRCDKTFRKEKFWKRHQSMCHSKSKKKLWQCSNCFKAFRRQAHHEQHQKDCISKGKRIIKETQRCENCSLLFTSVKKLLKHQAICCPDSNNHMVKLLKCLKCSMVFPSYKKQLKHRAVCCPDSDTDAMVCHYCSKVLIMKDRMEAHRRKCLKAIKMS